MLEFCYALWLFAMLWSRAIVSTTLCYWSMPFTTLHTVSWTDIKSTGQHCPFKNKPVLYTAYSGLCFGWHHGNINNPLVKVTGSSSGYG